jgi:galactitol-specific phosphotransferase system IIC component
LDHVIDNIIKLVVDVYNSYVSTETICYKHLYTKKVEMRMQRSLIFFAMVTVVALISVASMPASQQASAHHTASTQVSTTAVHHKAHTVLVDPQAHGIPLLNATALKKELIKEVKGPYGESDVIGGMMSGGY